MRTIKPGAAFGTFILPPGDSLYHNTMQMLKPVLKEKI